MAHVQGVGGSGDQLRVRLPDILGRWERKMRDEIPRTRELDSRSLINNFPVFLEGIAQLLDGRIEARDACAVGNLCAEHAHQRTALGGFSVDIIVNEYQFLRQVLAEVLSDVVQPRELRLVHLAIEAGVCTSLTDYVARQAHADRRTHQLEEEFLTIVNNVQEYAIFTLDTQGIITSWNIGAQRIKGYTADEAVGRFFGDILYREEERKLQKPQLHMAVAASEGRFTEQYWRVRKGDHPFWADVTLTPVRQDGELVGFVKITRDLTEQRKAQEALRQHADRLAESDRQKDHFLAMLGHELRNPLGAASNAVHLIERARIGFPF